MIKFSFHLSIGQPDHEADKTVQKDLVLEIPELLQAAQEVIRQMAVARSKSTIDNYETALRSLIRYTKTLPAMPPLNALFMEGFLQWLLGQGISLNTISCYMRSLRSLLIKIYPKTEINNLFEHTFTGKTQTEKRSISLHDAKRLSMLQLPPQSSIEFSRDLFLFSFYALGMPFVDMAFLRKSDIRAGYIVYNRHKTGQRIRVRIEPPMQDIIERYRKQDSPFVFPIITSTDSTVLTQEYETVRSRYNRHLRRLGKMLGLPKVLTSYVARHSWASAAYQANVELAVISKALGHTSPNTTLTYIREIDDSRIDSANSKLIEQLSKET